jgi:hypothetical protein
MKSQPKIGLLSKKNILVTLLLLTVVAFAAIWLYQGVRQTEVSLGADQRIDLTPQQIQSIKDIGQWEFLSVSDEQLVDTTRRGIFSDDHLVRIYYGTMRLGIDMRQLETGWIQREGDSLTIILPPIGLLDRDFIDEARTRSFHESGRWTAQDREALLKRAYQRMLQHGMTNQNIESARQNGEALFRQMMRSMGFEHVHIQWTK